jgi:hypothetical protein
VTSSEQARGIRSRIGRWLREPLLHFVVLGAIMFVVLQGLSPRSEGGTGNEIVVSEDDLRRIVTAWVAQRGTAPSPEVLEALVRQEVREEVLAREAVALGLDRGDPIVRRRLAQKMDFLAADIAALQDPSEADLRTWYAAKSARFGLPPRVSFHHLYYSFDRGADARDDAVAALERVSADANAAGADPFMFRDFYAERTPEQVAREFGAEFAAAVFELSPGAWSHPVQSGYGWHLVYVDALAPGRAPSYEEVASDVKLVWLEDQQRTLREKAYEMMLARYKVVVPDLPAEALAPNTPVAPLNAPFAQ